MYVKPDNLEKDDNGNDVKGRAVELFKCCKYTNRLEAFRILDGLNIHDAPGIPDLKQLELWNKWRNLINDPKIADEICPKPRLELLKRLQDAKRKKDQDKRNLKAEALGKGATKKKKTNKRKTNLTQNETSSTSK